MRHKILLLLLAILSVAVDATELPTDPAQWQPSTHYELTTAMTLDSAATFPRNSTLTITDTGHLKLTNGSTTLDCATGSAIIIDGGELELAGIGSTVYCEKGNSIVLSAGEIKLAQRNTHLICDTASRITMTGGRISLAGVRSSLDLYDGSTVDLSGGEIRLTAGSTSLMFDTECNISMSDGLLSLEGINSSMGLANGSTVDLSGGEIRLTAGSTSLMFDTKSNISMSDGLLSLEGINSSMGLTNGSTVNLSGGEIRLTSGSASLMFDTKSNISISDGLLSLEGANSLVSLTNGSTVNLSGGEIRLTAGSASLMFDTKSNISMSDGLLSLEGINSSMGLTNGSTVDLSGGEIRLSGNSSSLLLSNNSRLIVSNGQISLVASNSSLTCHNGGAIIMSGGYIDGIGQLIGRHGAFSAPIMRVIDPDVALQGDWRMDRAYPQWFAADDCDDWSVPINKAINMKGTGEVFLPRGNYPIKATIYVNFGIQLVGEGGRNKEYEDPTRVSASIIHPVLESEFDDDFMVKVNIEKDSTSWSVNNPIPGTELRNLYFYDRTVSRHLGVLAAGGFTADCVTWNGTKQAVAFLAGHYSDQRRITNCTYYSDNVVDYSVRYAFDLNCLGDAVVFEGNHVSNYRSDRPALRVSETGGATIVSNILNSDVLITSSKAVYFGANHCETGAQVRCVCSTVKLENNFYEKGERPSVVIEGNVHYNTSVVSMDGEMFGYYDGYRGEESREQAIARLEAISEYDIGIDRHSQLSLNNTYRYDILCNNGAGTQYTYGVNVAQITKDTIQGETLSLLADFFKYSHVLSASSRIQPGFQVVRSLPLSHPDSAYIVEYGPAGLATWFGRQLAETDTSYHYVYQYDIYGQNGTTVAQSGTLTVTHDNQPIRLGLPPVTQANLMNVTNGEASGKQLKVKFTRRLYLNNGVIESKTVTVPLSGVTTLFDNGVGIGGYRWK